MIELVQLERRHDDFEKRNTRVLVASMEELDDAKKTQAQFPHLIVLADETRKPVRGGRAHPSPRWRRMAATSMFRRRSSWTGSGTVRWLYRSPAVNVRLSPEDVLTGNRPPHSAEATPIGVLRRKSSQPEIWQSRGDAPAEIGRGRVRSLVATCAELAGEAEGRSPPMRSSDGRS